jgi:hypothetical protein
MDENKKYLTPVDAYKQLLSRFVSVIIDEGVYTTIFTRGTESAEQIYNNMIEGQKYIIRFLNKEFLNNNLEILNNIYRIQNSLLKDELYLWKSRTFTECSRTVPKPVPASPNCGPENDNLKLRNTALANIKLIQKKLKELGVTETDFRFSRRSRKTSKRRSRKTSKRRSRKTSKRRSRKTSKIRSRKTL